MKLYHTPSSPYVRKVLVMAYETGQDVEIVPCAANPVTRDQTVVDVNPTGRIPTAILDDGEPLYDSRVITRWLDTRHDGPRMYPEGDALWPVLRREAMADGLLDAALLARFETAMRPADLRWPEWLQGQMDKIGSSLDRMDAEADSLSGVDAGTIAVACALSYLDFRFSDYDWRGSHPALAAWYAGFAERDAMKRTALH